MVARRTPTTACSAIMIGGLSRNAIKTLNSVKRKRKACQTHEVRTKLGNHFLFHYCSNLTSRELKCSASPLPSKFLAVRSPTPLKPPGPKSTVWVAVSGKSVTWKPLLKMRLWGALMLAGSEWVLVGEWRLHENRLRGRLELWIYQVRRRQKHIGSSGTECLAMALR